MTELRKRMIEDMRLAGLAQSSQDAYVRVVRQLATHFRLSPDRLTERQLDEAAAPQGIVPSFCWCGVGLDWGW